MKILIIIHNRLGTGPFLKVLEFCKSLSHLNNEVTLVCTSNSNKFRAKLYKLDLINIIEAPDLFIGKLRQGIDPWNSLIRYLVLRKKNFDLIHAIDCRPTVIIPAIALKIRLHIPLIISWWDDFSRNGTIKERNGLVYNFTFGFIEQFFNSRFRKFADYSIAISFYLRNKLIKLGIRGSDIDVIRLGSVNKIDYKYDKKFIRSKLSLPKNEIIFIYLGSIFNTDLELLLDSLVIYHNRYGTEIKTILIGQHDISNDLCKRLSIIKTGFIEDDEKLNNYLLASDYAFLPLKNSLANKSRWPSKVADYFAMNLITVFTPVGELKKLYKDYDFGYMSKTDSPVDFANSMNNAVLDRYDKNKHKSKLSSINRLLKNELNWESIAKKHLIIYEKTIKMIQQ